MGVTYSKVTSSTTDDDYENIENIKNTSIFDVNKDVECERDWIFTADTGVLPGSISIRMNMPSSYKTQTNIEKLRFSSISYAVAYVLSYDLVTLFRPSVEFIDKTMKSLCVGKTQISSRMAIKSIQKFGVCEYSEYSDGEDSGGCDDFPSKKCILKAHNFNRIAYFKVTFETIKKAICMGYPVILCVEIFNNNQISVDTIINPIDCSKSLGSIAIVVTGYDDCSNSFEYINCVNSEWGKCDYSILKTYGHSMWVLKSTKYEDILEL